MEQMRRLESRMREIRPSGSEGGAGLRGPVPTPILRSGHALVPGFAIFARQMRGMSAFRVASTLANPFRTTSIKRGGTARERGGVCRVAFSRAQKLFGFPLYRAHPKRVGESGSHSGNDKPRIWRAKIANPGTRACPLLKERRRPRRRVATEA